MLEFDSRSTNLLLVALLEALVPRVIRWMERGAGPRGCAVLGLVASHHAHLHEQVACVWPGPPLQRKREF